MSTEIARPFSSPPLTTRRPPRTSAKEARADRVREARRQLRYELVSGVSGGMLALFMWGHMLFVASILTGERGFDWLASSLEHVYIAQPTVIAISVLFLVHAVMASRKIPAQLRERRRKAKALAVVGPGRARRRIRIGVDALAELKLCRIRGVAVDVLRIKGLP